MTLGHWLKSYLNEDKANNGGGGSGGDVVFCPVEIPGQQVVATKTAGELVNKYVVFALNKNASETVYVPMAGASIYTALDGVTMYDWTIPVDTENPSSGVIKISARGLDIKPAGDLPG